MKKKLSIIIVPEGRRNLDPVKVAELAESIKIIGLLNPIVVDKNGRLIAGGHRLEAYRLLGFDEIECIVLDEDELKIELAEIDENLIRNDLDDISIGEMAIRRDEILEALGLRAKAGDNQHTGGGAESALPKTTAKIAKEINVSERVLQENKQLARKLEPEAKKACREKGIPKSAALKLARLKPEQQQEVVEQLAQGKDIKDALPKQPPKEQSNPIARIVGDIKTALELPQTNDQTREAAVVRSVIAIIKDGFMPEYREGYWGLLATEVAMVVLSNSLGNK